MPQLLADLHSIILRAIITDPGITKDTLNIIIDSCYESRDSIDKALMS